MPIGAWLRPHDRCSSCCASGSWRPRSCSGSTSSSTGRSSGRPTSRPWVNDIVPGLGVSSSCTPSASSRSSAGLTVALVPRFGAPLVAAWLFGIVVNLLTIDPPRYYDIALARLRPAAGRARADPPRLGRRMRASARRRAWPRWRRRRRPSGSDECSGQRPAERPSRGSGCRLAPRAPALGRVARGPLARRRGE